MEQHTIVAVGVVVTLEADHNKLVAIQEWIVDPRTEKEKAYWGIPAGYRKPGETSERAVRRELKEKTGITTAKLSHCLGVFEDSYATGVVYVARVREPVKFRKGKDIEEVTVISPEQLLAKSPLRPGVKQVIWRYILEARFPLHMVRSSL